ncbi:MAG: hypothetical protein KGJ35_02725 [Patescibacteria group bacterium]|nr:hypothetical protein [Patescibacteria group bacterium]
MQLPKTGEALTKLGFDTRAVEYMLREIGKVLALYPSPEKAAEQLEKTLPPIALSRFGEKQFATFLRDIHPDAPHSFDIKYLKDMDWRAMEPDEIMETKEAIAGFEERRRKERETWLESPYQYEALLCAHFRPSKSDQGKERPRPHIISVPMGGQPKR